MRDEEREARGREEHKMEYLSADEYTDYGLEETTSESLVQAASGLIDAHFRRNGFGIAQYKERFRVGKRGMVRLSYLPLAIAAGATSAIVDARGRYSGRGDWTEGSPLAAEIAAVFAMPNVWMELSVSSLDVDEDSGEVVVGVGLLAPALSDLELTYTAGYSDTPEAVKQACARLVKNALATPALNVKRQKIDRMYLEYFADTLVDSDVKRLLAPYVAQRLSS
jgi:hypothetical protein